MNSNISDDRDKAFRPAAILFRYMAMGRGIEGAAVGYFSPDILELFVFRYCIELETRQAVTAADVLQFTAFSLAVFPLKDYQWYPEMDVKKPSPSAVFLVYHPICKTRLLNPLMNTNSTHIVEEAFMLVSKAKDLHEFTQYVGDMIFYRYRYLIQIVFGRSPSRSVDGLEVMSYRHAREILYEARKATPGFLFRPWPYLFTRQYDDRPNESYLLIFCGDLNENAGQIVPEEIAWARFGNANMKRDFEPADSDTQPSAVRRLNALIGRVQAWIKGAGTHHRSGSGGSKGAAATETHSAAHRTKKLVRERFSRDLGRLVDEARSAGQSANAAIQIAEGLKEDVLNK